MNICSTQCIHSIIHLNKAHPPTSPHSNMLHIFHSYIPAIIHTLHTNMYSQCFWTLAYNKCNNINIQKGWWWWFAYMKENSYTIWIWSSSIANSGAPHAKSEFSICFIGCSRVFFFFSLYPVSRIKICRHHSIHSRWTKSVLSNLYI